MSSTTAPGALASGGSRFRAALARFESPVTTYYVIALVTATLVILGLIMVLSASSIVSMGLTSSAYSIFLGQLVFAAIGTVALLVASRLSVNMWKRLSFVVLGTGFILQLLVQTPLGKGDVKGNSNWIEIAGISVQPSEVLKLGLALTGGVILAAKRKHLASFTHVLVPYLVPVAAASIGAVLVGSDLGTALILGAIVAAVLFAAGVPSVWFVLAGVPFIGFVVTFVVTSPNRLGRFDVWLGRDTNVDGPARQPIHGRFALADGGWFGLGLGASREKWGLLPEPHNDFIFAIIGEELGLPGTLSILALFGALALVSLRLVARSDDMFVRVATAGIMTWILVQAIVNIGAVIGLLPVIGLPLPLVSSGGSSLITTMLALGVLLSFARAEPGCAQALAARPSALKRSIGVVTARSRAARR